MELAKQVEENTAEIKRIAPLVDNHEVILYGDRSDRRDEGVVGMQNDIKRSLHKIEKIATAVAIPLIISSIYWLVAQLASL
jgi:hypothetical protein